MNSISISDVLSTIETHYPLCYQESFDNSGLQVGDPNRPLRGIMLSVETTEAVLCECAASGCNLLVTHHPLLFRGVKRISAQTYQERCIAYALQHDIVIYAAHTSADNASAGGINHYLADRIGLLPDGRRPMIPRQGDFFKLQVFVPHEAATDVRAALDRAGAGSLGGYTGCSFSTAGTGRFRPGATAHPAIGTRGEWVETDEEMISALLPRHLLKQTVQAMIRAHPYEVPAYELIPIGMDHPEAGAGLIGRLPRPVTADELLKQLSLLPHVRHIAYSEPPDTPILDVALCGGSGGGQEFVSKAAASRAQAYITGEAKYNDYLDAQGRIWLITIGHYESEQCAKEMLYELLSDKYCTFAVRQSQADANPVHYFLS